MVMIHASLQNQFGLGGFFKHFINLEILFVKKKESTVKIFPQYVCSKIVLRIKKLL